MERAIPNLPVDDLGVAKSFYVDKLGFGIRYEVTEDGKSGLLGLERGGFVLHLDSPMGGHGRNVVATLEVGDTDALYDQWSGQVEIGGPPRNEVWGSRTFGVSDPFGNLLYVVGPVR